MRNLQVTTRGRITLTADLLLHLGVLPGEKLVVSELPNGRIELRSAPSGKISDTFGLLSKKRGKVSLSIAQINRVSAQSWAGKR
jgi:antitoxin PrlF